MIGNEEKFEVSKPEIPLPPQFRVEICLESCSGCKDCLHVCTYGVYGWNQEAEVPVPNHSKCVNCKRCVFECSENAITITEHPSKYRRHGTYDETIIRTIMHQSSTGGVMLASTGTDHPYRHIFDDLLLDAAQVTNPALDPLREPIETLTYLGRKPEKLVFHESGENISLETEIASNLEVSTPILIGHMSLGSISYNAYKSIFKAANELGILAGTGEGGLHKDFYKYSNVAIGEVASGRFGVNLSYLKETAALEIKIGQGAKPGHGGHLPGEKVSRLISETRMIPDGTDALSPYPHHDIYSIEDLDQLIHALKEVTRYEVPVGVKIAAVHNSSAIAAGVVRSGADFLTVDGFRGGTGAAPRLTRDHSGIPVELAIASVDKQLRDEGIRNEISLIASGSIRYSPDLVKAIALGADFVSICTPILIAMGCTMCGQCHRGICTWGIATQKSALVDRLNVELCTKRIINLVEAWTEELRETLGSMGIDSVNSLIGNRDRLRYIGPNPRIADILGVKHAGEAWG